MRTTAPSNPVNKGDEMKAQPDQKAACLVSLLLIWLLAFRLPLFGQNDTPLLELLEAQLPSNRLTVAMVPLETATGDPALD